jgi:hypothetical protein
MTLMQIRSRTVRGGTPGLSSGGGCGAVSDWCIDAALFIENVIHQIDMWIGEALFSMEDVERVWWPNAGCGEWQVQFSLLEFFVIHDSAYILPDQSNRARILAGYHAEEIERTP